MKLRRTAAPLVMAALAVGSIAATGPDGTELPTAACANEDGNDLLTPGTITREFSASAVTYPSGTVPGLTGNDDLDDDPAGLDPETRVAFDYVVDVVAGDGSTEFDSGFLNFQLAWDSPSDHELFIYDADGDVLFEGTKFNPTDGSTEGGTLAVEQCQKLTFETKNYLGVPAEQMTLTVTTIGRDDEPDTAVGG